MAGETLCGGPSGPPSPPALDFGIQMFGHVAKKKAVHGEDHIRNTVDYVREGRKNNFDESSGPQARAIPGLLSDILIGILVIWRRVADRRTSDL